VAAISVALIALPCLARAQDSARPIELRPGLVITRSVRVVPKVYHLPAHASLDSAVIVVRGDDVTVDFAGATLEGIDRDAPPDHAAGVAIRVEGGHNVRILNARVHGYKVAILARGTRGLTLARNDLSYNWKPRLYSLVEHESLVDWLSFHHNENDEWLRYGAAAYLVDVTGGEMLRTLHGELGARGVELAFAELKGPVRDRLRRYGINAQIGDHSFFPTIGVAVAAYLRETGVEWLDWEDRR